LGPDFSAFGAVLVPVTDFTGTPLLLFSGAQPQASDLRKIGAQLLWNISVLAVSRFNEGPLQRIASWQLYRSTGKTYEQEGSQIIHYL
jgi:hypothetical protein